MKLRHDNWVALSLHTMFPRRQSGGEDARAIGLVSEKFIVRVDWMKCPRYTALTPVGSTRTRLGHA